MMRTGLKHIMIIAVVFILTVCISVGAYADFSPADARSALLVFADNDEVLYSQDSDLQLPPASTAKIMTALLVLEALERGETEETDLVYISQNAVESAPYDASSMDDPIKSGEHIRLIDLL